MRYVPASTGVHGKSWTSQRGVVPTHWGGVFVVLASCLAARSPSICGFVSAMLTLIQARPPERKAGGFRSEARLNAGTQAQEIRRDERAERRRPLGRIALDEGAVVVADVLDPNQR